MEQQTQSNTAVPMTANKHTSMRRSAGPRRLVDTFILRCYDELCQMASRLVATRGSDQEDASVALVHDVYLRLREQEPVQWANRGHFMAWSWQVMKWIVADRARQQRTLKRGGLYQQVDWDEVEPTLAADHGRCDEVIEALDHLRGRHPRRAAVVESRIFGGYTLVDTAAQMGISVRTAEREWRKSKVYLRQVLDADAVAA